MIEIEKKYNIDKSRTEEFKSYATSLYGEYIEEDLTDIRFDIKPNNFGGNDFKRLRLVKSIDGDVTVIYTEKYNIHENHREENEYDIPIELAREIISQIQTGKILKKRRFSWHDCRVQGEVVSISLDILEGHKSGYIEIETLEPTNEREAQLYEIFNNVAFKEWSLFDLHEELKSMLSMSEDIHKERLEGIV